LDVHEIGTFCSATTKEMGLICEIGGPFSLVRDLVLVWALNSLPTPYIYIFTNLLSDRNGHWILEKS